jgi:hypothetical protein
MKRHLPGSERILSNSVGSPETLVFRQRANKVLNYLGDLAQINTTNSVAIQLTRVMELLGGFRFQDGDLLDISPALMLRLHLIQGCYYYLKRYTDALPDENYHWNS